MKNYHTGHTIQMSKAESQVFTPHRSTKEKGSPPQQTKPVTVTQMRAERLQGAGTAQARKTPAWNEPG